MSELQTKALLFYASGDDTTASVARGQAEPTFLSGVKVCQDRRMGSYLQCDNDQALAWKAPGNIYASRGTLAFFWRSRYPVGATEFPLFRVAFSDHSSWDACWLRIDYSGNGFDAMITDINLSRARVRVGMNPFPSPEEWVHLALSWDECYGIRFYVNGALAAEEYRPGVYTTGLDQFGPHSRIIANWHVISDYNFIRGGDIARICIYDHMLADGEIRELAGDRLPTIAPYQFQGDAHTRAMWRLRLGMDQQPPTLLGNAWVRKVEIHDAYDLKRWWWKACDGIRETTWPGVLNRSRLKGRNDYFQLPDWDCYTLSGKAITFTMPQEPYNWVEIAGSAHGALDVVDERGHVTEHLFDRPAGCERSENRLATHVGQRLRFTNVEQEEPIGDFSVFHVTPGACPAERRKVWYRFPADAQAESPAAQELTARLLRRFQPYERHISYGVASDAPPTQGSLSPMDGYPSLQLILPYEQPQGEGMDGLELTLPALPMGGEGSYSIQVRDPLWYDRCLMHFTFRTDLSQEQTLFLDTRDRILPEGKCLLVILSSDRFDCPADLAQRLRIAVVYKAEALCKAEHTLDRFTQVRDVFGHMVEERPVSPLYDMYNRYHADVMDLMRVAPDHVPGKYYAWENGCLLMKDNGNKRPDRPDFRPQPAPESVPGWAYKQVQFLKRYKYLINWYIDNRQIENGEFGGGLSDDGDYTSFWVGLILMGCNAEKVLASLCKCNEAFYEQGMFTNGLCSIQTDELHSAEEGVISLTQCLTADFSNPRHLERAMENARSLFWLTGINQAGHRHIRSTYFSGSHLAQEAPWGGQRGLSGLVLAPSWYVARYTGNPALTKALLELADGLLAHHHPDEQMIYSNINFADDSDSQPLDKTRRGELYILLPAYWLTGDEKYYNAIDDRFKGIDNPYVERMNRYEADSARYVDKKAVEAQYDEWLYLATIRQFYNTEGSPWIDRVKFDYDGVQYDRLAGIGHERLKAVYPRNRVAWRFDQENDDEKLGILSPIALPDQFKLILCNLSDQPLAATMLGGEVTPGEWELELGVDENDDDLAEKPLRKETIRFERGAPLRLTLPHKATCVLSMRLLVRGEDESQRYDLGLCMDDVKRYLHGMIFRVHSLGAKDTPEALVVLRDPQGRVVRSELCPPLPAPVDLWPRYREISFNLYDIPDLTGYTLEIDPHRQLEETTRANNILHL